MLLTVIVFLLGGGGFRGPSMFGCFSAPKAAFWLEFTSLRLFKGKSSDAWFLCLLLCWERVLGYVFLVDHFLGWHGKFLAKMGNKSIAVVLDCFGTESCSKVSLV